MFFFIDNYRVHPEEGKSLLLVFDIFLLPRSASVFLEVWDWGERGFSSHTIDKPYANKLAEWESVDWQKVPGDPWVNGTNSGDSVFNAARQSKSTDSKNEAGLHVCAYVRVVRTREALRRICFHLWFTDQLHRLSAHFVISNFYSPLM